MILNIECAVDELTVLDVKLHVPFTSRHWIRLNYAHLPELPLNNGFDAAVSIGAEPNTITFNIPPFSSLEELCDIVNAMRGGNNLQFLWAFYDGREFDLCTGYITPVVITEDLMNFLKLPYQQLATSKCWSSALFPHRLMTYSHWNIYVKNLRGMYNGLEHSELLAKVRDDGTIYGEAHSFESDVRNLQVSVIPVQKDGVIVAGYTAKSNFSIGIEFGT